MKKQERAVELLKNFPEHTQQEIDGCLRKMKHFMMFRHDRTECRCGNCNAVITDTQYLTSIDHKKEAECPACHNPVTAMCDCYPYSVEYEQNAKNFVIFRKGENQICYAFCIRIRLRMEKKTGKPAQEFYRVTETQRYAFDGKFCYRYGREHDRWYDLKAGYYREKFSGWRYLAKYTEPTWDQGGMAFRYSDNHYQILDFAPVKDTCLQYAQLGNENLKHWQMFRYIQFYTKHPNIEYLIKLGLEKEICEWFSGSYGYKPNPPDWIDWKQNDVRKMLGMNAYELREIISRNIDIYDYHIAKRELNFLTDAERLEMIHIVHGCWGLLGWFGNEQNQRKLLNYLRKQNQRYSVHTTLSDYRDYLSECRELGYSLREREIYFPRCLADAHRRTSDALNAIRIEKARKADEERRQKETALIKISMEARQVLAFRQNGLLICIPESATEIVNEGKNLHHCVAGYATRHANGKLHILFIRQEDAPETSFYTMEVSIEGQIMQVRGEHNCDPTPEVQNFVDAYKLYLKSVFRKKAKKARIST